jgi:hypothetical protein
MTPQQQTALEGLVGRALTEAEVEQIDALLPARNDDAIAAILSVGRTEIFSRMTTVRGMDTSLPGGAAQSEVIMLKLEGTRDMLLALPDEPEHAANRVLGSVLRRRLRYLDGDDGLDFGAPAFRAMLDDFQAKNILTADEVTGLKGIAQRPAPISTNQVSDALNALGA